MKRLLAALLLALPVAAGRAQTTAETVVVSDIAHFWEAYDALQVTTDSTRQYALFDSLFIDRGSPGLRALMARREYTSASYVEAINAYPQFWDSVRANTLRAGAYGGAIEAGVDRLRTLYPALRPARVYFTVGALMTNGTTLDSLVLIGSELALADSSVVTTELPGGLGENLRRFFDSNTIDDVVLLSVHEVVHTQQGPFGADLLAVALQEGVAEFVSVLAMGRPSAAPAVAFGEANEDAVRERFVSEMFSPHWDDWLYNNTSNAFGVRDLGYYVGYAVAERYYDRTDDKRGAIARLVDLDYQDPLAVEALVEASGYFDRSMGDLRAAYERAVPTVVGIAEFDNGDRDVDPDTRRMTVTFSAPMNPRFRGFEYGPLGEGHVLRVIRFVEFSADGRTMTVEVDLQPGRRHQVTLSDQFRDERGRALKPYLVDITTGASGTRRTE